MTIKNEERKHKIEVLSDLGGNTNMKKKKGDWQFQTETGWAQQLRTKGEVLFRNDRCKMGWGVFLAKRGGAGEKWGSFLVGMGVKRESLDLSKIAHVTGGGGEDTRCRFRAGWCGSGKKKSGAEVCKWHRKNRG